MPVICARAVWAETGDFPISGGTSALSESLARLFCLLQKEHRSKNLSFQLLVQLDTPLKIYALIIRDLITTYYIPVKQKRTPGVSQDLHVSLTIAMIINKLFNAVKFLAKMTLFKIK
jgi:hypothetical protein